MPRSKEQFEKLRNKKIELIEKVAMECFAKKGFYNTSINHIAKEAGISTGLTYNYFSSKEELLKSIFLKGIKKVFAPVIGQVLNREKFIDFIEHIFREIETNKQFWRLYFIVTTQPDVLVQFQEYMLENVLPVISSLTDYFREKSFADPEVEAQFLFSTIDGVCINYLINSEHYPLNQIKQKILRNYE